MKYLNISIVASLILLFCTCSTNKVRNREVFTYNWKFYLGDDSLAYLPEYNDEHWRTLNLPHDWSIEGEFSIEHLTKPAGGALPAGIGWYRKTFFMPESEKNMRCYIDFDGIYRNSEVWLNGHYIGKRANGYVSFSYDLTSFLNYGNKENIMAVRVDNSLQPNSRWYTGSGIYRNVWLTKTPQLHINHRGVFVTTPGIISEEAQIDISFGLDGITPDSDKLQIVLSIFDRDNKLQTKAKDEIVFYDSIQKFDHSIIVKNPILWSVDDPCLYQAKIELFDKNKKIDEFNTNFGIRYYEFKADSGFCLNGKSFELRGVNLHHDLGALGAAVNIRAIERQLEIMKGMGVNAIRTAHNPPAPELLDLCDRMGFLVMDEAFDVWRKRKVKYDYSIDWEENYKQDLQDLILRDRNHPSVIVWSIGNEIPEQFDSSGITLTRELVEIVKNLDSTRPVTCALTETDPTNNFIYQSCALDVLGFNYKHKDWTHFKKRFPGEKIIAAENMSAYATRGHYDMPSDSIRYWPEKYGDPIIGANEDYTVSAYDNVCAFWGATHEETLKEFYKTDFLNSIFIWSGFDFLGEPVPYEWPAKNSYYGIVDLAGFPKDIYFLYQSIWTDTPTLHVFPHWNWEVGQLIDVWAYFNKADEVELFLNEKSLGIKRKAKVDMHVMWRVNYKPGTLKAVSRKDGEIIMERVINTAGDPAKIELVEDKSVIKADGTDLSFITVKVLDKQGNLVPDSDNLIKFDIEGCGFIAGVDNGYQASHEPFKSFQRKAFKGLCLAIIQSTGERGKIRFKASSNDLESSEITLFAK